jgi:hypothetical protein
VYQSHIPSAGGKTSTTGFSYIEGTNSQDEINNFALGMYDYSSYNVDSTSRHKLLIQLRGKKLKDKGIRVRYPAAARSLFLCSQVHTCSGVRPSQYNGYGRRKRLGREAEQSFPHSSKVKKCGDMPPLSPISSWHGA